MADDDDDAFSFGDFTFALPPQPQPQPQPQSQSQSQSHINGVTSTSINNNDNLWVNFLITPHLSSSSSSSSSQFQFNNGFSSNPTNLAQPTPSIRADPGPNKVKKPKGALPLSLFGEVEVEDEDESNKNDDLNKWVDSKSQNGKFGVNDNGVVPKSDKENGFGFNINGAAPDLIVDNHKDNNDEDDDGDDDDEWEFKGAFSDNGVVKEGNSKDESVVSGFRFEPFAMAKQEKQAGQDAFSFADTKPGSISFALQSIDLFALSNGNGSTHQSSGLNVGFNSTTSTTNGFMWDPFSVAESIGNGSGMNASLINQDDDDEFDDFGDFIDASLEVASKEQQGQVIVQMNPAEAQIPNGEVQEKQTQTEHSRGALPLSFFRDVTEESSDGLDLQNEVVHKATVSSGNSFSGQGSVISINDLISNLYSQAQLTSPVNTTGKPAENGMHSPQKAAGINLLCGDDDWDGGSWEFKGAVSENGVGEQLSTAISEKMAQKQSGIFPELRDYMEFYDLLKDSLCFLLSCQLDELKKVHNSDAVATNGGKSEAIDDEIQEAFKLLEESVNSKEELAKKNLQKDSCLNKLLEVLQGPKFNVIESDFQLSKRLQLAEKEWRVAAELLRHAISMLKILSAGSTDEQPHYASTWSKIIGICVQELRHGALIWKRASEKNVQHQMFSNSRGQQNILALGEIYKVVKLLELSAKLYRPIVLPSVSDSSQFFGVLDECDALWLNIGLEELVRSLSDNLDFGCSESARALIASIKNIHGIDVFALHTFIFIQRKPICQLSLLPQDMLYDLKTVMWGEKAYYLNLANLWANLISCEPPQLPLLQVC